ncbi:DUF1549 domain-containing protein, partial [Planctomycetota bacterium]|nr:DUF1549 domain-containing protein [Planctomycetota bacterium]
MTVRPTFPLLGLLLLALPAVGQDGTSTGEADSMPPAREVAAEIDELAEAAWKEAEVRPAAKTTDAEFLRRAFLDTQGHIPRQAQVMSFLAEDRANKRELAIERLVNSDDFSRSMAVRWANLLVGR